MSEEVTLSVRVAEEVRAMLARRRVTGRELARRLGVSQPWVSYRLTGHQEIGLNDLERIAAALDVPVSDLLPAPVRSNPNVRSLGPVRTAERRIGRTQPALTNPPQRRQLNRQPPQRVPRDVNGRPRVLTGPTGDSAQ